MEPKANKSNTWKEIVFGCLALLFLGSLFYSYHVSTKQSDKLDTISISQLNVLRHVDSTKSLVSVLRSENKVFHENLKALMQERKDLQIIQKQISRSYDKIYDEISRANSDSVQLTIYDSLIAKHRRLKLERE